MTRTYLVQTPYDYALSGLRCDLTAFEMESNPASCNPRCENSDQELLPKKTAEKITQKGKMSKVDGLAAGGDRSKDKGNVIRVRNFRPAH